MIYTFEHLKRMCNKKLFKNHWIIIHYINDV